MTFQVRLKKKKNSDGLLEFMQHLVTEKKYEEKEEKKNWNKKVLNFLSRGTRNYSEYSLVIMSSFSFSQQNIIVPVYTLYESMWLFKSKT